eukprot:2393432-Rhodomonas_salina.1
MVEQGGLHSSHRAGTCPRTLLRIPRTLLRCLLRIPRNLLRSPSTLLRIPTQPLYPPTPYPPTHAPTYLRSPPTL